LSFPAENPTSDEEEEEENVEESSSDPAVKARLRLQQAALGQKPLCILEVTNEAIWSSTRDSNLINHLQYQLKQAQLDLHVDNDLSDSELPVFFDYLHLVQ
jgi:hypothetical protein